MPIKYQEVLSRHWNNSFISNNGETFTVYTTDESKAGTYTIELNGTLPNDQTNSMTFTLIIQSCYSTSILKTNIQASISYDIHI